MATLSKEEFIKFNLCEKCQNLPKGKYSILGCSLLGNLDLDRVCFQSPNYITRVKKCYSYEEKKDVETKKD